jgi:hypothetical protein
LGRTHRGAVLEDVKVGEGRDDVRRGSHLCGYDGSFATAAGSSFATAVGSSFTSVAGSSFATTARGLLLHDDGDG